MVPSALTTPVAAGLTALAALSLIGSVSATGTVLLSLEKKAAVGNRLENLNGILKRDASTVVSDVFDIEPWSGGGAYYTNVTVGTPPQTLTVILDTGSSDLYFDASSAASCEQTTAQNSCRGGSFDPSSSTTYKVVAQGNFSTQFGDGSTASGDYSTDVVGVGNVQLPNVQFGVASNVNSTTGFAVSLMGVGYSFEEAAARRYPNIPEILKSAGAINSRLYSVFLNQLGNPTGTILFGGIDTSQYTGTLQTLNLLPLQLQSATGDLITTVFQFVVSVTGVSGTVKGKTTTFLSNGDATGQDPSRSLPVLLDTGSAAWTVPRSYYNSIAALWPNSVDDQQNILCSHQHDNVSLSVEFGGSVTIQIPGKNLIVPLFNATTNAPLTDSKKNRICTLMVVPNDDTGADAEPFLTLGDAILRSMYVVFDLDNGQVSIAQANTNPGASSVKVVPAGANGIASAVGSGGVNTVAANAYSIAAGVKATQSYSFATAATAVGTASGTDAVPEQGRITFAADDAAGSQGAASTLWPEGSSGIWIVLTLWLGSAVLGFGLVM